MQNVAQAIAVLNAEVATETSKGEAARFLDSCVE